MTECQEMRVCMCNLGSVLDNEASAIVLILSEVKIRMVLKYEAWYVIRFFNVCMRITQLVSLDLASPHHFHFEFRLISLLGRRLFRSRRTKRRLQVQSAT